MSQRDAARLLGMTRGGYSNLENGDQRVLVEHLYVLAKHWKLKTIAEFLPAVK